MRAAIFSITAQPVENAEKAVFQAFHILNQFDIPVGSARHEENGVIHTDYTQLTAVHNPISLCYFFKSYEDETIRMVDLNTFNKNSLNIVKTPTLGKQAYIDISSQLK